MMRSNKAARSCPLAAPVLAAGWHRLLLGFSLLLVAAGCSTTPANIGVGLPSVDNTSGAFLVDTLTLRATTVLRDSVVTSTTSNLLVGRYIDPQLGTITARSYTTLAYGGAFTPDRNQIADSIVLVLKPDTYRYGDTTKTQTLVEVHELNSFIPVTSYGFASPKLTPTSVKAAVLNETTPIPLRRARPNLTTLRIRLDPNYGRTIMNEAKNGLLSTQDQFDARHPGLALLPGANDAAALVRFSTTSTDAALILYYHDPTDVSTAQYHGFTLSGSRHFYQAEATGQQAPLPTLTSLGQLDASRTGQQTYIEGLLGLQTKIEIPYLFDLRSFGQHFIITSAMLTAEVPVSTLSTNLTPPASLSVSTTDQNNHQGTTFISATPYSPNITSVDGITQAGYSWSVLTYCQNVLNNNIPNNGMLLNTATPTLPDRVVLGGPRRTTNKMTLRLYLISNN
ncbi:MAG: DUF4270 family protein [Janthinobacterium lividum]